VTMHHRNDCLRDFSPQQPILAGATRRATHPARHGLIPIHFDWMIEQGDGRSSEANASPTPRPVASQQHSSPFALLVQSRKLRSL
jgi:hypothetical protein